ncbi:erythromycin esterase family protein [Nocardia panacis]|uniref:Erythromycin esterase family protein n=1 Tax=Nocardia panacis TaxID=2340916 RepID=A0A3A4KPD8_9NOCA|nr:erythromycin esterase family protein [Nocardia panacis]RJO79342.1 erythromycin esterase family protein [Nocardia panacis]
MAGHTVVSGLSAAAVHPLTTLDPTAPLTDLAWLDEVVGQARIVGIGESSHLNREALLWRHRLVRYLVERHGFDAVAIESGFADGRSVDDWVRGGTARLDELLAQGISSFMGLWTETRGLIEWLRERSGVSFDGIDLGGSNVSALPALDAALAYLAVADPDYQVDPALREIATAFGAPSVLSLAAALTTYAELPTERRDALTAGLAELTIRFTSLRLNYVERTSVPAFDRARRALAQALTVDAIFRDSARGGGLTSVLFARDAAMADTVELILKDRRRVAVAAHNAHILRGRAAIADTPSSTMLGLHLVDRFGADYVPIGTTMGSGRTFANGRPCGAGEIFFDLEPARPDCLDALMTATHDGLFGVNLRGLSAADRAAVQGAGEQRVGFHYVQVDALAAYDALIHLPTMTAATPDVGAIAASPLEVREFFAGWTSGR